MQNISETVEQLLGEFFTNVNEHSVSFSFGDLFDTSHCRIKDVFLKTEAFNALPLPFQIQAGYLHEARIEGFVGIMMGSPLTLYINSVCLVLSQQQVDWNNELLLRHAKEMLVAVLQTLWNPSYQEKKSTANKTSNVNLVSPVKWVMRRLQAAIANMTIKIENVHIRFESEFEDRVLAYGLFIPMIRFTSVDADTHILRRRQQHGVEYPTATEELASKLMVLENVSFYCDLHATPYCDGDPQGPDSAATRQAQDTFRDNVLKLYQADEGRDVFFASGIWVRTDFVRRRTETDDQPKLVLAALDVATEALKVNVDFTQMSALSDELDKLGEFFKCTRAQHARPSCINTDAVAPPSLQLSLSSLLPDPLPRHQLVFGRDRQRKSRAWFRAMWKFATRAILVKRRQGNAHLVRFQADALPFQHWTEDQLCEQYVDLYTRNLSNEALSVTLVGKKMLLKPKSPQRMAELKKKVLDHPLPNFMPLTRAEQWLFSDMIYHLPVRQQLSYRALADSRIRTGKVVSTPQAPVVVASPSNATSSSPALLSPRDGKPALMTSASSPRPHTSPFPPEYLANHHNITRSATESAIIKPHAAQAPRPAPAPIVAKSPRATTIDKTRVHSPTTSQLSKQFWFQRIFLPRALLKREVPLINWHLGKISLTVFHSKEVSSSSSNSVPSSPVRMPSVTSFAKKFSSSNLATPTTDNPVATPSSPKPERERSAPGTPKFTAGRAGRETFLEISFDGCSGSLLICRAPVACFLVEMRLGLFTAMLFNRQSQNATTSGTGNTSPRRTSSASNGANSITSDYIREPDDGFFYVGLKYNCKQGSFPATSLLQPVEVEWDLKAKVCVGAIKIDYNEMELHTALLKTTNLRLSQSFRLSSPSYFTVIKDVYKSWKEFLHRFQERKKRRGSIDEGDDEEDDEDLSGNSLAAVHAHDLGALDHAACGPKTRESLRRLSDQKGSSTRRPSLTMKEAQKKTTKRFKLAKILNALLLHSTVVEIDTGALEVRLALMTDHLEKALGVTNAKALLFDHEQVHMMIPKTHSELQNRPLSNECHVEAAGSRIQFRSTKQGRAAIIEYLLDRLSPVPV